MSLTRRHVLAGAAAIAAAGSLSVGVVAARWWDQPASAPLAHLSIEEVAFLDALADAVFPEGGTPALSGRQAHVSRYVDAVLIGMVPMQRELLRLGLHALDALAVAETGAFYSALDPGRAASVLRGWLAAGDPNLRGLAQSMYIFVGMAYLAHPDVAPVLAPQFRCGFGVTPGGFGDAG